MAIARRGAAAAALFIVVLRLVNGLADALQAIPHRSTVNVDLKGLHDRTVVEVLASGRGPGLVNAVVSSFEPVTLERVGGLAPAWPRWLNAWYLSAATIRQAVELVKASKKSFCFQSRA